ncbi:MAG: hypothetical protein LBI28_03405 [Treponema sp.]|jgi:hypothetical protein|nr:hypothetical protein [Treponema sp.]
MKNPVRTYLLLLVLIIICFFIVYNVLPIKIKYYDLINNGNKIVAELEIYYELNKKYPEEFDWEAIETIYRKTFFGDNKEFNETTQPWYNKNNDDYVLHYFSSFDGPYLFYSSKNKKWDYGVNMWE